MPKKRVRNPAAVEREILEDLSRKVEFPVVLGIDPDLHFTGLFILSSRPGLRWASTAEVDKTLGGFQAASEMRESIFKALLHAPLYHLVVVEGQELYRGSDHATKNALSIVHLAFAAGCASAAALMAGTLSDIPVLVPPPKRWKGNVPKPIHQARTYTKLGWSFEQRKGYSVPTDSGLDLPRSSDWKHVGDAAGLALWGKDQFMKARVTR